MKALIIDDSKAMRMILGRILTEVGCTFIEASHGRDALEKIAAHGHPDLVLVDWNMPEMNGLEFIEAIKSNPSFNQIKLMMITTESEVSNMEIAKAAGADEYIIKPFSAENILEKLSEMKLYVNAITS